MAKKKKAETSGGIPIRAQRKMGEFELVRSAMNAFLSKHGQVLADLKSLEQEYLDAEAAVKDVYREFYDKIGETYGEFRASRSTKLDLARLEMLDPDLYEKFVKFQPVLDMKTWSKLKKSGDVPAEIAAEVEQDGSIVIRSPKSPWNY